MQPWVNLPFYFAYYHMSVRDPAAISSPRRTILNIYLHLLVFLFLSQYTGLIIIGYSLRSWLSEAIYIVRRQVPIYPNGRIKKKTFYSFLHCNTLDTARYCSLRGMIILLP